MLGLLYVLIGGFFEPVWVMALERAGRSTVRTGRALWYGLCMVSMVFSLFFLSLGMRTLNIGIAYAVWTAVGAVLTIILSRIFDNERFNAGKIVAIFLILAGISGLQMAGGM